MNAPDGPILLITGGTGFVGSAAARGLEAAGYRIKAAARSPQGKTNARVDWISLPDISQPIDWTSFLDSVDAVVQRSPQDD